MEVSEARLAQLLAMNSRRAPRFETELQLMSGIDSEDASPFSRDYKRHFGRRTDAKRREAGSMAMAD